MKKLITVFIFCLTFFVFAKAEVKIDTVAFKSGLIFVYDLKMDSSYFFDKTGQSTLKIERELLRHYSALLLLKQNFPTKPITIAINLELLEFLDSPQEPFEFLVAPDFKFTSQSKLQALRLAKKVPQINAFDEFANQINYEVLNSTRTKAIDSYLQTLSKDFIYDVVGRAYLAWLDEYSLEDKFVAQIFRKSGSEYLTKDDLKLLIEWKKAKLKTVKESLLNKPNNWKFLVYPYSDTKIDLLASSNINSYLNDTIKESVNLPYISMWHIAKSFKTFAKFFVQEMPQGIVSDVDFIDVNVFNTLAVRDYEILLNKGEFLNYEPVIIRREDKNICILFQNIKLDSEFQANLDKINDQNYDAILVFDAKLVAKDELLDIYRKIFKAAKHVNAIDKFNKNDLTVVNILEQDFIINLNNVIRYFDSEEEQNYWQNLNVILKKIEDTKNKENFSKKDYQSLMTFFYQLTGRVFLENLELTNEKYLAILKQMLDLLGIENDQVELEKQKVNFVANTVTELSNGLVILDAIGDDYGDGSLVLPEELKGIYDLRKIRIFQDITNINFEVVLGKISKDSLAKLQIDIYIDLNGRKGLGNTRLLEGRKAMTDLKSGWEYCISLNARGAILYQARIDGEVLERAKLDAQIDFEKNSIKVILPQNILTGNVKLWKYIVLSKTSNNIVDLVCSGKEYQEEILKTKDAIPQIPAIGLEMEN